MKREALQVFVDTKKNSRDYVPKQEFDEHNRNIDEKLDSILSALSNINNNWIKEIWFISVIFLFFVFNYTESI